MCPFLKQFWIIACVQFGMSAAVVVCFEPRSSNDAFAKVLRANDSVRAAI
jgi:hypothetical protein